MSALTPAKRREIERACARLSLDYSYFADNGGHDAWAELFADDGELQVFGAIHVGRKAIRASVGPRPHVASLHVVSNIRIDALSETEAEGTAYVALYVAERKEGTAAQRPIAPVVMGLYHDRYVKTAAGWRFARRAFAPSIIQPPA